MWKCSYCQEEISKDKYKNCWNCGKPRVAVDETEESIETIPTKPKSNFTINPPIIIEPLAELKLPKKFEPKPKIESESKGEITEKFETSLPKEHLTKTVYSSGDKFFSQFESDTNGKSSSIIGKIIPVLLWLAAVSAIAYFAYSSNQKTVSYERKIAEEFEIINNQRSEFVFPQIPLLRRGTVIEGNVKAKVLPLKVNTGEIDSLFSYLPDDLRPTNLDEVKTLMWIDCENNAVGKYPDGKVGYREKCTAYLIERETSKFIGIQEFLGVMPTLGKEGDGENTIGKVFPEKYVAYLREKQLEDERGTIQNSFDSPNHHLYNKSEFIYAMLLLGLLAAIGFGWLAFNLRFNRESEK